MNYLRPDERSSQSDVEQSKKFDQRLKTGLKTAANVGLAATGLGVASKAAGPIASRIMPFLSEFIPAELALKGISKISPSTGKILDQGLKNGLNLKDGLDFLRENSGIGKETSEMIGGFQKEVDELGTTPKEKGGNIIQKYSDQLHELISSKIKRGIPPLQAAADAKRESKGSFSKKIDQIEKDYKTDFANIVEAIYGKGDMAQSQQQPSQPITNPNQMPQQGNPQAKDQLLQAMQALSQKLRT